MRIQLQNTTYYPVVGGIENYLYYASKELRKLNHTPLILCSRPNSDSPLHDTYEGIKILRRLSKLPILPIPLYDSLSLKWLQKFIEKSCEDIDAIWSRHPYYCFASCKASLNIPIIYIQATAFPTLHRFAISTTNLIQKAYQEIRSREDYHIERYAMERCSKIVVLSKMRMREISDFYNFPKSKFEVIPPGIALDVFAPAEKDECLLKELEIPRDAKIILSVGRIRAEKNFLMLVEAFARVKEDNIYLVIVGDGPQKAELMERAKELNIDRKIRLPGYRKDIAKFYSIADIFVLPSRYEGFGHVYLEAMAAGIPCIGLKADYPKIIVACEEIIKNGETGYCVRNSVDDLTEKIEFLLSNVTVRKEMGIKARQICQEFYSWERHVGRLLEITHYYLAGDRR